MWINSFPDMVNYTAYSDEEVYTPEDVKTITLHAKLRGVRIIPEIDQPAHV